jgi:hypothetical protein
MNTYRVTIKHDENTPGKRIADYSITLAAPSKAIAIDHAFDQTLSKHEHHKDCPNRAAETNAHIFEPCTCPDFSITYNDRADYTATAELLEGA